MSRIIAALFLSCILLGAQTKKVVVSNRTPEVIADWQSASDKIRLVPVTDETVMAEIVDADAYIGNITPAMVRTGKNLKWTQTTSAGVERVLHLTGSTALRDSDIILTNNQIVQGPEIADHAFAMLLAHTREIPKWLGNKDQELWRGRPHNLKELKGKNALIIGMGGIGQQITVRAWAFGMTVVGVDPEDIPFSPMVDHVIKPDQINSELPHADVVFMAAPHTPQSENMIGPEQFELMKRGSYFIAVSRGSTYHLASLVKALDSQRLAGAGVDVVNPEPLPKGHPLWQFDNVIITPHVAGRSDVDQSRMLGTVKENLRRFGEGLPLVNVVDKQKGW
jgi:phosphoglycerate dehydrogenase-like enzyme